MRKPSALQREAMGVDLLGHGAQSPSPLVALQPSAARPKWRQILVDIADDHACPELAAGLAAPMSACCC
jgi:hypothetical protein